MISTNFRGCTLHHQVLIVDQAGLGTLEDVLELGYLKIVPKRTHTLGVF